MCSSGGKQDLPPVTPEAATMPEQPLTGSVKTSVSADRKRRAAATGQGAGSTILTSSRGVSQPGTTASKTLLGE